MKSGSRGLRWDSGHKCDVNIERRQFLNRFTLSALSFGAGGCELLGLKWHYRYRLTGTIEANGHLHSGSSVIEVVRDRGYDGIGGRFYGDAVTIDIPNVGPLFLLLSGAAGQPDWTFTMPHYAFARQLGGINMVDGARLDRLTHLQGAKVTLAPELYPAVGRFERILHPRSFRRVNLQGKSTNFSQRIRFKEITVEITDDPVTRGIEKTLPWLNNLDDYKPNMDITSDTGLPSEIEWLRNR